VFTAFYEFLESVFDLAVDKAEELYTKDNSLEGEVNGETFLMFKPGGWTIIQWDQLELWFRLGLTGTTCRFCSDEWSIMVYGLDDQLHNVNQELPISALRQ